MHFWAFPEQILPKLGSSEDQQWDEQADHARSVPVELDVTKAATQNPVPSQVSLPYLFQNHALNTTPRCLELHRAPQLSLQGSALYLTLHTVLPSYGGTFITYTAHSEAGLMKAGYAIPE